MIKRLLSGRPGPEKLMQFNQELLGIVTSRIPIDQGLALVAKEMAAGRLRSAVERVEERIRQGASLSQAVEEQGSVFPDSYRNLIAVGERMGNLTGVLEYLVSDYRRQADFQRTMTTMLTYPAAVLTLALGIMSAVLVFVMPKITDIFLQLSFPLPPLTLLYMDASYLLVHEPWVPVLVLLGAGGLIYAFLRSYPRGHFGIPLVGAVCRYQACASFLGTLGMLLQSGVPAVEALGLCRSALANGYARGEAARAQQRLEQGAAPGEVLSEIGFLPPITASMLHLAAGRSDLPDMLTDLAEYYDNRVRALQASFTGMLEPFILVALGGFIAVFLISIYLPLFALPGTIH